MSVVGSENAERVHIDARSREQTAAVNKCEHIIAIIANFSIGTKTTKSGRSPWLSTDSAEMAMIYEIIHKERKVDYDSQIRIEL